MVNSFHLASVKKKASVTGRIGVHPKYIEEITRRREDKNFIVLYYEKVKFIYSSHRVISFLLYRKEYFCTNNSVRAENDVIDTLKDMENTPRESRM